MTVFLLEIRNLRKSAFAWALSISAVIFLMLTFFPSMQTEAMQALSNAKLESIDPALLAALGMKEIPDFTVITNFFGYVLQYIILAFMVYVTHQTVGLLVKEESDGTIEYLYAKPVSRKTILLQKYGAHCVLLALILMVFALVSLIGYLLFSKFTFAQSLQENAINYGAALFVSLVFSAIGLLASSLVRSTRSAAAITIGVVFGTFVIGALSKVVKGLDFLIYLSPMDWIKTQKLMSIGLTPAEWAIGFAILIGCPLLAWAQYRKKDLLV